MKAHIEHVYFAFKETFSKRRNIIIGAISFLAMLLISIFLPFLVNPTNTIENLLYNTKWYGWVITVLFALLFGMVMAMHRYARKLHLESTGAMVGKEIGTGFLSMIGGMFSGPLCVACVSSLLTVLGAGSGVAVFLLNKRPWLVGVSLLLVLGALYFASNRVVGACEKCKTKK